MHTDETDLGNDTRLVDAMRELAKVPTFSIADELAKLDPNAGLKRSIAQAKEMLREKNIPLSLLWLEE